MSKRHRPSRNTLAVTLWSFAFALLAAPVYANAGISMICCISPGFWLLLPAVIVLEAILALVVLRKGVWKAVKIAALANAFSTLVGVPVRWLLGLLLYDVADHFAHQIIAVMRSTNPDTTWASGTFIQKFAVTVFIAPMGLAPDGVREFWIRLSWGVLLVPFFLLSVCLERWVAVKLLKKEERKRVWLWAFLANATSYALIFAGFWHLWGFSWWWMGR